jgi:thiosulfate/3-mercaptopyruvate sulfurtransferase
MIPAIVDVDWLKSHPHAVLADVRWYLDGRSGAEAYASGHLPGAVFLDIDTDLSAPPSLERGRHPLPDPEDFAAAMVDAGISADSVVVAYDDMGGVSAGRLVWMLRSLGVDAALLDGGIDVWDGPLTTEEPQETDEDVTFGVRGWGLDVIATIEEAVAGASVIDARSPERYRGDGRSIDTNPGHIPGALSAPALDNLGSDKRFRPVDELRDRFAVLGVSDASEVIAYCGSGVSACHDLLAMEHAGLERGRLFVGSWSQYSATDRPVATGADPGIATPA